MWQQKEKRSLFTGVSGREGESNKERGLSSRLFLDTFAFLGPQRKPTAHCGLNALG